MRLCFDLESDGFLDTITKIHCLAITDLDTGQSFDFADQPGYHSVEIGLQMLSNASLLVGHNIITFDIPAIQKVAPSWTHKATVRDTIVCTRLMWPHIGDQDFRTRNFPRNLIGGQSLEAWGYRLGNHKGHHDDWSKWSPDMHQYMIQDVSVTVSLWKRIVAEAERWGIDPLDDLPKPGKDCIALEHRVAEIVAKVVRHGVKVNEEKVMDLLRVLTVRKAEVTQDLQKVFPPKTIEEPFIPKVNNKTRGYVKGETFIKTRIQEFNPGSRQQVAARLQELGWEPSEFGKDGVPTVDEETLLSLPYPQAKVLAEYFKLAKTIGQIGTGEEAWLKHLKDGRIHGFINPGGAHTGRMTHSKPNLAQVIKVGQPWGKESRTCFEADPGYELVGVDADGLELRDMGGYMAFYDGGAYIETILEGKKENGTDMHTINSKLVGCSRDTVKTFFYAMIYGSGDANLGAVLGAQGRRAMAVGKRGRKALMEGIPALGKLTDTVQKRIKERGFLIGLDGRRLRARSGNAALNTLLQSAGAVQMKRALVILYDVLESLGWEFGREYSIVLIVHDEWQTNVKPELVDQFKVYAPEAIARAGEFYAFKCPLKGNADVGKNWADTH